MVLLYAKESQRSPENHAEMGMSWAKFWIWAVRKKEPVDKNFRLLTFNNNNKKQEDAFFMIVFYV